MESLEYPAEAMTAFEQNDHTVLFMMLPENSTFRCY